MPIFIATVRPKDGCAEQVESILRDAVPQVQQRDGCEVYALNRNKECFVIIEKWKGRDAVRSWADSEQLKQLHDDLEPLVDSLIDNVVIVQPVPLGDMSKGVIGRPS